MTATASAVAGLPDGYSPAEVARAGSPLVAMRSRSRASAMGDRHWFAVQTRRTSMGRL